MRPFGYANTDLIVRPNLDGDGIWEGLADRDDAISFDQPDLFEQTISREGAHLNRATGNRGGVLTVRVLPFTKAHRYAARLLDDARRQTWHTLSAKYTVSSIGRASSGSFDVFLYDGYMQRGDMVVAGMTELEYVMVFEVVCGGQVGATVAYTPKDCSVLNFA